MNKIIEPQMNTDFHRLRDLFIIVATTVVVSIYFCANGYTEKLVVPQRIISVAPSITESLYLLGVEDRLVAVTTFCKYPPAAKTKAKIGTIIEPSIEKIVSLKPDLVLFTGLARPEILDKLHKLGINIRQLNEEKKFEDICKNFIQLGQWVGKENRAKQFVLQTQNKIKEISKKNRTQKEIKIFWQVGSQPVITIGRDTFVDELIQFAGGINITHNLAQGYTRISREEVVKQNPEIIVLVGMDTMMQNETKEWQKYPIISAVKNKKIYNIDPHYVCSPIPTVFAEGVKQVNKIFYSK